MAEVVLFLDLASPPCRAVYLFAKANNIPFQNHVVHLFKGEQLTEEFGKVNPLHKVPALKDGDFTMGESNAILLYLARKFKTPDHWYPSDLQKRAVVDEYLAWHHTNTHPGTAKLFWIKAMTPHLCGHEAAPEKLKSALSEFDASLTAIQNVFLKDKLFFAGDEISIADLVAVVDVAQVYAAGLDVFEDKPKLAAWKLRVKEVIGVDLFKEAHKSIMDIKEMQKQPISAELKEKLKARLQYFNR